MENAYLLNDELNLSGVVSEPQGKHDRNTAVLMINSGFLHHIGPYRFYTELSRKLAMMGFQCLRFDLSGVGDSLQRKTASADQLDVCKDISEAMDFMQEKYKTKKFVVLGLCSGADDSFSIASHDDRVAAAIMIDGHGYRTPKFYIRHLFLHYGRRLLSLQKWRLIVRRVAKRMGSDADHSYGQVSDMNDGIRKELPQREVLSKIQQVTDRGCKLYFVYTGGVSDYYNYEGQFFDSFPSLRGNKNLNVMYMPFSDHLLMQKQHRYFLMDGINEWLEAAVTNKR